jgi:hypothetical protein
METNMANQDVTVIPAVAGWSLALPKNGTFSYQPVVAWEITGTTNIEPPKSSPGAFLVRVPNVRPITVDLVANLDCRNPVNPSCILRDPQGVYRFTNTDTFETEDTFTSEAEAFAYVMKVLHVHNSCDDAA